MLHSLFLDHQHIPLLLFPDFFAPANVHFSSFHLCLRYPHFCTIVRVLALFRFGLNKLCLGLICFGSVWFDLLAGLNRLVGFGCNKRKHYCVLGRGWTGLDWTGPDRTLCHIYVYIIYIRTDYLSPFGAEVLTVLALVSSKKRAEDMGWDE